MRLQGSGNQVGVWVACGSSVPPTHGPVLTEDVVKKLVSTSLVEKISLATFCFSAEGSTEALRSRTVVYDESGVWAVTVGRCAFVVDDATGKVIGP